MVLNRIRSWVTLLHVLSIRRLTSLTTSVMPLTVLSLLAQHNVRSLLPLSILLLDTFAGTIVSSCARRILAMEALLRARHLGMDSDDENTHEHTCAEVPSPGGPCSHRVLSSHSRTTVPIVQPPVGSLWPGVTSRPTAVYL